ncbi:carbonic anhydrase [Labrys wisconsinensis]|uniref:Carbonic anhydrase n=1 Tax=Labrys wisconsinensis TaxID=425677 RepID=A0ABU0J325_9HYPH|nr:carbonic anhydrase [Labrys wisconsinensis]MDQ0467956.1 carbonic anhydrase [Labrys wisconsinensis]
MAEAPGPAADAAPDAPVFPERLSAGYRSFLGDRFRQERQRYEELAESGQNPEILLIGCCDSRVSPEVIFDARPGELFVVRNVANLVPPYETGGQFHGVSAALEFAVQALMVKHIVVMGHARCGGIRSFAEKRAPLSSGDFIGKWMSIIAPAADMLEDPGEEPSPDYITRLELAAVDQSLANLMTFGSVRRRVAAGEMHLHGAYFGIATGRLLVRDPADGVFKPLVEHLPERVSLFGAS